MTIEQIKKHKYIMKWFLDNPEKGVWYSEDGEEWTLVFSPSFRISTEYVINDDWADLSKQFITDKTKVEYLYGNTWVKTKCDTVSSLCRGPINNYRIVSLLPHLKIGDWFTYEKVNHQVVEVLDDGYRAEDGFDYCEYLEKWVPRNDELVVLYNNHGSNYIVGNYVGIYEKHQAKCVFGEWDNVAPIEYSYQLIQNEQDKR